MRGRGLTAPPERENPNVDAESKQQRQRKLIMTEILVR
jgi:hypothetical protein